LAGHNIQPLPEFLPDFPVMGAFYKPAFFKRADTGGVCAAYGGNQNMDPALRRKRFNKTDRPAADPPARVLWL
jgi:hypothetical protein